MRDSGFMILHCIAFVYPHYQRKIKKEAEDKDNEFDNTKLTRNTRKYTKDSNIR